MAQLRWENSVAVSYKPNMQPLYHPAAELLGIYPRDTKIYVHSKTCTLKFISSFSFNSLKNGNNPNVLQVVGGKDTYSMYDFSAITWNEPLIHVTTWKDLQRRSNDKENPKSLHTYA